MLSVKICAAVLQHPSGLASRPANLTAAVYPEEPVGGAAALASITAPFTSVEQTRPNIEKCPRRIVGTWGPPTFDTKKSLVSKAGSNQVVLPPMNNSPVRPRHSVHSQPMAHRSVRSRPVNGEAARCYSYSYPVVGRFRRTRPGRQRAAATRLGSRPGQ